MWTGVIVTQVAFTVVFLLSVASLAWTILSVQQQYNDVAFRRSDYLIAQFAPKTDSDPKDPAATYRDREEFLRRLSEAPEVANATYTTRLPGADGADTDFAFEKTIASVRVAHIGPGFFETFNREVIAGRLFTLSEIESGASVAIVDESFVRYALGARSAVGLQVREPGRQSVEPGPWIEIVGVTADMSTAARKAIKDAHLYRPIGAVPPGPVTLVVHAQPGYRTEGLGQVAAAVRATAAATLRVTRVSSARPMNAGARRIAPSHHHRHSLEAFLQIGLGVAAGVLPGGVIVGLVSAESGRNGLVDGITVAAAVAAFVLIIAAAACSVPLRRALRIEPTEALRVT